MLHLIRLFVAVTFLFLSFSCRTPDGKEPRSSKIMTAADVHIRKVPAHTQWLDTIAIHPQHPEIVLTGGGDGYARLWNMATGSKLWEIRPVIQGLTGSLDMKAFRVTSAVFSPSGRQVVFGCDLNILLLVDTNSGAVIRTFYNIYQKLPNRSFVFSHDGRFLASHNGEGPIIWNIETGKVVQKLNSSPDHYMGGADVIRYSADDRLLFAIKQPNVAVWNLSSGELIKFVKLDYLENHHSTWGDGGPKEDLSLDGRFVVFGGFISSSTSQKNLVKVVNLETGNEVQVIDMGNRQINTVSFADDVCCVLVATDRGVISRLNLSTGEEMSATDLSEPSQMHFTLHSLASLGKDNELVAGGMDGKLYFWSDRP